jgi:hypothetical protein
MAVAVGAARAFAAATGISLTRRASACGRQRFMLAAYLTRPVQPHVPAETSPLRGTDGYSLSTDLLFVDKVIDIIVQYLNPPPECLVSTTLAGLPN